MPRSLRLRVALIVAVSTLAVAAILGGLTLEVLRRGAVERTDSALRAHLLASLRGELHPRHRVQVDASGQIIHAGRGEIPALLLVWREGEHTVFRSGAWPESLRVGDFEVPDETLDTSPRVGRLLPPHLQRPLAGPPPQRQSLDAEHITAEANGSRWRFAHVERGDLQILMGLSLDSEDAALVNTARAFLVASVPAALLAAAVALALARPALRPLRAFADRVSEVTAEDLQSVEIPEPSDPDLARLAENFRAMLARLDRSFHQATRFSADAAHELRTPLTILQGRLGQMIEAERDAPERQRVFAELLEEVSRLHEITRRLLFLAQSDAGKLTVERSPVDLSELAESTAEDLRILAPETEVRASVEPGLTVGGDRALLSQMLQNLGSNALKYNREGGAVTLTLARVDTHARLVIANTGPGIPDGVRDQIFDRFRRGDTTRSRETDGLGLGLSLVREILRAHGGEITLVSPGPPETSFVVTLPLVDSGKRG